MPIDSSHVAGGNGKDTAPSRLISGQVDGRTRAAVAFKGALTDFISDLGGEANASRAEIELAMRAAGLSVLASQHESDIINGESVEAESYVCVVNAQSRVLGRLGLRRRAKPVPDLQEYIAAKGGQQ